MLSERSKIAYAKSVLRRQYTGNSATSGLLTTDKFYQLRTFKSGDDFSNVGLPDSVGKGRTGAVFQATGTTPTTWSNGSKLIELKVAELRAYSLEVFSDASETIAITSTGFEGGNASGTLTFEKALLGIALEELLAEFDPDYVATSSIPRRASGYSVLMD